MRKSIITFFIPFVAIFLLYLFLRLSSISSHSVAFTYDQGRDFLAGARIITDKNPVFIGPTTGIGGVFHGAWWYYFTALSFFVLGPNPVNFYIALLIVHIVTYIGLVLFIRKIFGEPIALIASLIIAIGGYFISVNTFAGNNILAAPSFVGFCIALWFVLNSGKKALPIALLSFGLAIGFVAEFELSFGMFLIPSMMVMGIFSKKIRHILNNLRCFAVFMGGFLLPFLPRILFEVKNGFLQTKVILGFFIKPKLYTPAPYVKVFQDRIWLFKEYIHQAFAEQYIAWIMGFVAIGVVIWLSSKKHKRYQTLHSYTHVLEYVIHLAGILFLLFSLSLVYRDPFWMNYYEGIQYGFLILGLGLLYLLRFTHTKIFVATAFTLSALLVYSAVPKVVGLVNAKGLSELVGLNIQESVINHVVNTQKSRNERVFCARVFTPPVIPHTYDYLWLQHYLQKEIETPRYDYINGTCWYIIEPEWKGYEFRQIAWRKQHVPIGAVPLPETKKVFNGIEVIEYKQK